jgi:hypothetical protein
MRRRRSEPRGSAGWQPAVSPTGSRQALRTTGVLLSDAPSPSPQREEGWGEGGRPRRLSGFLSPRVFAAVLPHPASPAGRGGYPIRSSRQLTPKPRPQDVPGRLPFTPSVPPDSFSVPPMTICVSPKAEGRRPATADSFPMLPAAFLVARRSVRMKSHALPLKV